MKAYEPVTQNPFPSSRVYRPDIDGLRAIAVLSVLVFHAWPQICPGGFAGVDIFFVISGFLISGHIAIELESRSFSFQDFYGRRLRRIFPALLAILIFVWIIGWYFFSPQEFKTLGAQIFCGAGFASNFILWKETGYFDGLAAQKPLLHLWSLAIEEQFYIFWPFILFLTAKLRRSFVLPILLFLVVSFLWNLALVRSHPSSAFYFPLTRVWELLLGALLAWRQSHKNHSIKFSSLKSSTGLAFIFASFFLLGEHSIFPGYWALLPTLGTGLVISAKPSSWLNKHILSQRVIVFIGLISYPLYLWHWPFLSFQKQLLTGPLAQPAYALVLSFIFAITTYYFIEKPLRLSRRFKKKTLTLALAMVAVAVLGAFTWIQQGLPFRHSGYFNALMAFYDAEPGYRYKKCFLDSETQGPNDFADECSQPSAHSPVVFLWGDSHAAHLYQGLLSLQNQQKDFRITQFTATSCSPLFGGEMPSHSHCSEIQSYIKQKIIELKPKVIILGSRWSRDQKDLEIKFKNTIQFLNNHSVNRIYIVGPPPPWTPTLQNVLRKAYFKGGPLPLRLWPDEPAFAQAKQIDSRLRAISQKLQFSYLSAIDALCSVDGCLTRVGNQLPDDLISGDSDHLTAPSSRYLIRQLFPQNIY
jgi:peptidoglycan/LPS O-acetylase OafA/YrhL